VMGDRAAAAPPSLGKIPRKTITLKAQFAESRSAAARLRLFGFVRDTAKETPTAGLSILGRLILVSLVGTLDGTIVVVHRDETAVDEPTNEAPGRAPDRSGA
jgi:hypothetical protein